MISVRKNLHLVLQLRHFHRENQSMYKIIRFSSIHLLNVYIRWRYYFFILFIFHNRIFMLIQCQISIVPHILKNEDVNDVNIKWTVRYISITFDIWKFKISLYMINWDRRRRRRTWISCVHTFIISFCHIWSYNKVA